MRAEGSLVPEGPSTRWSVGPMRIRDGIGLEAFDREHVGALAGIGVGEPERAVAVDDPRCRARSRRRTHTPPPSVTRIGVASQPRPSTTKNAAPSPSAVPASQRDLVDPNPSLTEALPDRVHLADADGVGRAKPFAFRARRGDGEHPEEEGADDGAQASHRCQRGREGGVPTGSACSASGLLDLVLDVRDVDHAQTLLPHADLTSGRSRAPGPTRPLSGATRGALRESMSIRRRNAPAARHRVRAAAARGHAPAHCGPRLEDRGALLPRDARLRARDRGALGPRRSTRAQGLRRPRAPRGTACRRQREARRDRSPRASDHRRPRPCATGRRSRLSTIPVSAPSASATWSTASNSGSLSSCRSRL